jgi:hypothetical protein
MVIDSYFTPGLRAASQQVLLVNAHVRALRRFRAEPDRIKHRRPEPLCGNPR